MLLRRELPDLAAALGWNYERGVALTSLLSKCASLGLSCRCAPAGVAVRGGGGGVSSRARLAGSRADRWRAEVPIAMAACCCGNALAGDAALARALRSLRS